ncbi:unnamed protein product [Aphanomyces euteiches]
MTTSGSSEYDLMTGIAMCLVGTTVSNFVRLLPDECHANYHCCEQGLNIQKYSFILQERQPEHERKPYNTQWRWWLGLLGVAIGSIADFAALTYAAQSIIAPVGAFTLVANIFFAHYWLRERLGRNDLFGTILICIGAVMVTIFGSHSSTSYSLDELLALYYRWDMLIYVAAICAILSLLYTMLCRSEEALKNHGNMSDEYKPFRKIHPLAYSGLSGIFGAQSVMFAKSTGELIKQTSHGDNQFDKFLTYVILVCLVMTISMQTHLLSLGLKNFDALYIVPVFTCFYITFSVLGGAVYFEEFKSFGQVQWLCFPAGVFITICGVAILSKREMHQDIGGAAYQVEARDTGDSYETVESPDIKTPVDLYSSKSAASDSTAAGVSKMDIANLTFMSQHSSSNIYIGIGICLLGSTISNLGLNIQKYSFMLQQHLPDSERKPYNTQWRWWLGFAGVGIGSVADFAALSFAAQSIIMPVGAFTLVCNIFFAHYWLKEKLTRNDLIGTVLICIGAVLVTIFGAHQDTEYTLDDLLHLYYRWDMLIYLILILIVLWALFAMLKKAEITLKKKGPLSEEYKTVLKIHPLSYAGLAGTFGAQSVMFAKSTGELIKQSARGNNQFDKVLTYVIILALVLTISLQTHCLSLGLKYFDALYIVPVFQCFFIMFSVISGAVYFEEFKNFSTTQWIVFPIGVLITIAGVIVLSSREMEHDAGAPVDPLPPASSSAENVNDIHLHASHLQRRNSNSISNSFRVLEPEFCPVSNPAQMLTRSSSVGGVFYSTQSVVMSSRGNSDFVAMQDNGTEMTDMNRPQQTPPTSPTHSTVSAAIDIPPEAGPTEAAIHP